MDRPQLNLYQGCGVWTRVGFQWLVGKEMRESREVLPGTAGFFRGVRSLLRFVQG